MKELHYQQELSRCVRCGICKSLCPTYLSALNETMGARGRVAILGALIGNQLTPTKSLSDRIFSCLLCEACKGTCPLGIDIPEIIYHGRALLKSSFSRAKLLRSLVKFSIPRLDAAFSVLRVLQKLFYQPIYKKRNFPLLRGLRGVSFRYFPEITSTPFKNISPVYKNQKSIGRVALFVGCSVNYLYPYLGEALLNVLITRKYEVVIIRGEVCCGAPLRSLGLEEDVIALARRNIELFSKMRVEAILSLCPTCTMVIRRQYPLLTGEGIPNIMDVNEFFIEHKITRGLKVPGKTVTYHDPCHLSHGLGIRDEPRNVLKDIEGIKFVEMKNPEECCGFGGLFSACFNDLSRNIGRKKFDNIYKTGADTVVTSCLGCMMQLEDIRM